MSYHPVRPILNDNHPTLRLVAQDVIDFNKELESLVEQMLITMVHHRGRGLAAPQINISKRVIVVRDADETLVMINPILDRLLNRKSTEHEGCLSVMKSEFRHVARPAKCDVTWQDVQGNSHHRGFSKDLARVIQHEIDHLNGVLITDYPIL